MVASQRSSWGGRHHDQDRFLSLDVYLPVEQLQDSVCDIFGRLAMGYCIEGEDFYDAFLSYASDDDDAHNGWVQDFESYLREMVEAELRRTPDVDKEDARHFRVCRDETGFPQHGDLDGVIDEKVRYSAFLFVLLGKAYLKSKYCLQ